MGKSAHNEAVLSSLLWEEVEQGILPKVSSFSLKIQQLIQTDGHKIIMSFYTEYRNKTFSINEFTDL